MKLNREFYLRTNVVQVAKELLGKVLFTRFDNQRCAGIITETEAYNGVVDKASHAYGGRRTTRTEIMYAEGGTAYVYLIYGLHSLFNVVTNVKDVPHAVLVRAIHPIAGISRMEQRRQMNAAHPRFTSGPGSLSIAMGIHYTHTGISLLENKIWIEDHGIKSGRNEILITPRIGVDYAGEDAALPYRFLLKKEVLGRLK